MTRSGVSTKAWGPATWKVLEGLAACCDTKAAVALGDVDEAMAALLELLPSVLPCSYCRASVDEFLKDLTKGDVLAKIRDWGAVRLVYELHERVSKKLFYQKQPNADYDSLSNAPSLKQVHTECYMNRGIICSEAVRRSILCMALGSDEDAVPALLDFCRAATFVGKYSQDQSVETFFSRITEIASFNPKTTQKEIFTAFALSFTAPEEINFVYAAFKLAESSCAVSVNEGV